VGTNAGVSSFDGSTFTNYSSGNGLAENGVRAICESGEGVIWFGHTGGGISRLKGGQFEVVGGLDSLIGSTVTSMLMDLNGHLWITTETSGVIEMLNPTVSIDQLKAKKYAGSEISDRVFNGYLAPSGWLYFVTDLNLKVYNRDSARFDNVIPKGVPRYYNTTSFLVDGSGNSWIGKHNGGLYSYNPETDQTRMYDLIDAGLSSNWVSTIFEDSNGNIWIGTWGGGMVRIDVEGVLALFTVENGLPGMKIRSISEDREQNILIGTQENGLCVYKGDQFSFIFRGGWIK